MLKTFAADQLRGVRLDDGAVRTHLTSMKTAVSTKGQVILPKDLRDTDAIHPGDKFEIERVGRGEYLFRRIEEAPNSGLVDWLLDCPVKDYFEPIPSELTDTL